MLNFGNVIHDIQMFFPHIWCLSFTYYYLVGFPSEKQFSTLRHLIKIVLWFYFLFLLLFRYFFCFFSPCFFCSGSTTERKEMIKNLHQCFFLLYIDFLFTNIETKVFFFFCLGHFFFDVNKRIFDKYAPL